MKVAVIGAGPAGLTSAYVLCKQGLEVHVFEASNEVGGLSRTIELWDMKADIGPHRFFSTDKRVNSLWLELVRSDYQMINRQTRILYNDKYYHYPLRAFNALRNLGFIKATQCVLSYLKEKVNPISQDGSFQNWVISRFGYTLFETFFKSYSEKLWGIPCSNLDADFAAQRIKRLSLKEAIANAVYKRSGSKHKTLIDQFAYPFHGTGSVYTEMQQRIINRGGQIHFRSPVISIDVKNNKVGGLLTSDGMNYEFDQIISSMPITHLVKALPEVPKAIADSALKLRFRNTVMVYLLIESEHLFNDNWLYIHSPSLQTGRITNYRNFSSQLYGSSNKTIVSLEYWCYPEDEFWNMDDDSVIQLAKNELVRSSLCSSEIISDGYVMRIPKCYPVYEKGYRFFLEPIEKYLSGIQNLQVIGRFGAFKYNNQDHSMLMGLLAAENIYNNGKHNLWSINTDYDVYQERSIITDTGLVDI